MYSTLCCDYVPSFPNYWTFYTSLCFLITYGLKCFSEYCEKYAKKEDVGAPPEEKSSDEELSEEENVSSDDEVAGKADP